MIADGLVPAGKVAAGPTRRFGRAEIGARRGRRPAESKLCGVYQPIRTFEFNRSIRLPKLLRSGTVDGSPRAVAVKKTDRQGEGSGQGIRTAYPDSV